MEQMSVDAGERGGEVEEIDLELDYSSDSSSAASNDADGDDQNGGAMGVEFGLYEPILSDEDLLARRQNPVVRVQIGEWRLQNNDW